jgi:hypothetical protein
LRREKRKICVALAECALDGFYFKMMRAPLSLLVGFVVLSACQTYEFEPVEPFAAVQRSKGYEVKASQLPPHIMILLDTSASMDQLIKEGRDMDGNLAARCNSANCRPYSTTCPPTCSTRINELRSAMNHFLKESLGTGETPPIGKFGFAVFPMNTMGDLSPGLSDLERSCVATNKLEVEFATSNESEALRKPIEEIISVVENLYNYQKAGKDARIAGGTPTGRSLEYLLNHVAELRDTRRRNFVLLMTDGLPNCNEHPTDCELASQCIDSEGLSDQCVPRGGVGLNCLDKNETVKIIEKLREAGIGTLVVGFGAEMGARYAVNVLNAMANAGGHAKPCGADPDCTSYYPASDREELVEVLTSLRKVFDERPCVFELDRPVDPSLVSVYIDGKRVASNTYTYDSAAVTLTVKEELCEYLQTSSDANPIPVEIFILDPL